MEQCWHMDVPELNVRSLPKCLVRVLVQENGYVKGFITVKSSMSMTAGQLKKVVIEKMSRKRIEPTQAEEETKVLFCALDVLHCTNVITRTRYTSAATLSGILPGWGFRAYNLRFGTPV